MPNSLPTPYTLYKLSPLVQKQKTKHTKGIDKVYNLDYPPQ